jgi:AcrR family transcriptional regulator
MANNELNTEAKILEAANSMFLLFGYHGTTIRLIADKAVVNTAAIHYYFRSKERLYLKVVENVLDLIINTEFPFIANSKRSEEHRWFLFTELYNNNELFERTLKELYPEDWDRNLSEIKKWLDVSTSKWSMLRENSD